jgi:asparagine synthase (glutamine-hydrolysing)
LGTEHTEIDAQALTFDRSFIDSYVACLGEPFADSSALAMWTLCQQVRPHVKVALSGDGGDELFLGYSGLHKQRLARRLQALPLSVRRMIAGITQDRRTTMLRRLNKYTRLSMLDGPDILMAWAKRWNDADLRLLLTDDLAQQVDASCEQMAAEIRSIIGDGATGGFAEQQIAFHMHVDLPCDCLYKVDRMSMAHGVEVRVPVLSNSMLSYAQRLPLDLRVHEGRTKEPLRTLANRLSRVAAQPSPKRGFSFPLDSWMRPSLLSYWRDWGLTAALGSIGFSEPAVDHLVGRYHNGNQQDGAYEREWLAAVLFDLLLLGVWVDNTGVRTV